MKYRFVTHARWFLITPMKIRFSRIIPTGGSCKSRSNISGSATKVAGTEAKRRRPVTVKRSATKVAGTDSGGRRYRVSDIVDD